MIWRNFMGVTSPHGWSNAGAKNPEALDQRGRRWHFKQPWEELHGDCRTISRYSGNMIMSINFAVAAFTLIPLLEIPHMLMAWFAPKQYLERAGALGGFNFPGMIRSDAAIEQGLTFLVRWFATIQLGVCILTLPIAWFPFRTLHFHAWFALGYWPVSFGLKLWLLRPRTPSWYLHALGLLLTLGALCATYPILRLFGA